MSAPVTVPQQKRVHPVDEVLPVPKLATYGFQHVVAFYAGAVLVPIIIAGAIKLPQEELVMLITAAARAPAWLAGAPLVSTK
ncbi:MAG: uric acid transporter [Mycobacterium sp.]|jgi:xanthine/uracil permease|nr:uric acid transporter [Mycobacterium sp.]